MKTINKYQYQLKAAKSVFNMMLSKRFIASVLAAAPGSGKSTILIHILNDFFSKYPHKKAVILTHNQNILKNQMIDNFENPHVSVGFSFGLIGSDKQVEIGIPANSSKIERIDLLVVDEAHQYYWESMTDSIVEKFNPEYQILMTGSPSYFIRYNKAVNNSNRNIKKFGMYFIAANDLVDLGVFSPIDLDVVRFNGDSISDKIIATMRHAKQHRYNMDKIMWACKNIKEAKSVAYYLKNIFKKQVFMSTSQNDSDNQQIEEFKKSEKGILIVVNKGILGFSDNSITALVDFKCSKNLDTRNQLFARGLRRHEKGIRKTYLSVSNSINWNKEGQIIHQIVSLMERDVFMNYDGKTIKEVYIK